MCAMFNEQPSNRRTVYRVRAGLLQILSRGNPLHAPRLPVVLVSAAARRQGPGVGSCFVQDIVLQQKTFVIYI